jgi:hypothetical protein
MIAGMNNIRRRVVVAPLAVVGAIFVGIIIAAILWHFFNCDRRDPPREAP